MLIKKSIEKPAMYYTMAQRILNMCRLSRGGSKETAAREEVSAQKEYSQKVIKKKRNIEHL